MKEEIEFEKRSLTAEEDKYTFAQSHQIDAQCGLIGYLRADMDTDGNGFFSNWNDWRKDLKTQAFKDEFDAVLNSLREEGDVLHNRTAIRRFYNENPQSHMDGQEDMEYCGIRVDTEQYAYLFRLTPKKGEYNCYCYCYFKKWLDDHIRQARRGIRFIDPHYNLLFKIEDGGKVRITRKDGSTADRTCRYIDEYHVEVGDCLYHICEFAEKMEYTEAKVEPLKGEIKA